MRVPTTFWRWQLVRGITRLLLPLGTQEFRPPFLSTRPSQVRSPALERRAKCGAVADSHDRSLFTLLRARKCTPQHWTLNNLHAAMRAPSACLASNARSKGVVPAPFANFIFGGSAVSLCRILRIERDTAVTSQGETRDPATLPFASLFP